jgi:hypothetical protein
MSVPPYSLTTLSVQHVEMVFHDPRRRSASISPSVQCRSNLVAIVFAQSQRSLCRPGYLEIATLAGAAANLIIAWMPDLGLLSANRTGLHSNSKQGLLVGLRLGETGMYQVIDMSSALRVS